LQLSHLIARSRGGGWWPWNVELMCAAHHAWCEDHPAAAERLRHRIPGRVLRGRYTGSAVGVQRLLDDESVNGGLTPPGMVG
jgi:hypothetical protein